MCTLSASNVIYHKFSHGAAFYTLNGKNVNVMLEFLFVHLEDDVFPIKGLTLKGKNLPTVTPLKDYPIYLWEARMKITDLLSLKEHPFTLISAGKDTKPLNSI